MRSRWALIFLLSLAVLIKIGLFIFATTHAPQSKFLPDSYQYMEAGESLFTKGTFSAQMTDGTLQYETNRTPGYPVFLGILHHSLKLPLNGVILVQILLTVLAGFIIYKAAIEINPQLGALSAIILLFDPVVSIFSMILLSESLFLFLLALFMFTFIKYLKTGDKGPVVLSALILAAAIYVRPGIYFLGFGIAAFVLYANVRKNMRSAILDGVILLFIIYFLTGLWQLRNYIHFSNPFFTTTFHGDANGMIHNFANHPYLQQPGQSPFMYYLELLWSSFLSLMTRPGSFKYFDSPALSLVGKTLGYLWVAFWMTGFIYGTMKIGRNIYFQFLLFIVLCFIGGTIMGEALVAGERFRVPFVPYLAVLSAYGWVLICDTYNKRAQMRVIK